MKVLIVGKYYYPDKGGVEEVVVRHAERLVELGHKVTVIAQKGKYGRKNEKIRGVQVYRTNEWFNIGGGPFAPGVFWDVLRAKYDVAVLHEPSPFSSTFASFASLLKGKPWIVFYHSDIAMHNDKRKSPIYPILKAIYMALSQKPIVMGMARRITPTSPQYVGLSDLLKDYRKKITVIPNGVDTNQRFPRKSLRRRKQILYVGRMIYYKGIDYYLEALQHVFKKYPDYNAVMVGEGPKLEEWRRLSRELGIDANIKWMGYMNDELLTRAYQESKLFVLPSTHKSEAFGIVLMEAQACGTPVVTTSISGTAYAGEPGGIVVAPKDSKALSAAIMKLIEDEELWQKKSDSAIENAKKHDWHRIGDMVETELRNALK